MELVAVVILLLFGVIFLLGKAHEKSGDDEQEKVDKLNTALGRDKPAEGDPGKYRP